MSKRASYYLYQAMPKKIGVTEEKKTDCIPIKKVEERTSLGDDECVQRALTLYKTPFRTQKSNHTNDVHKILLPSENWNDIKQAWAIRRRLDFRLPLRLTKAYWRRHQYTVFDIEWTLSCIPAIYVWHLCLLENVTVANTAVKACHAKTGSINYGGQATAIAKLVQKYEHQGFLDEEDKSKSVLLWKSTNRQTPLTSIELEYTRLPLPFHPVTVDTYNELKTCFEKAKMNSKKEWLSEPKLSFDCCWRWNQIDTVPLRSSSKNEPYLLMGRILPYNIYTNIYRIPNISLAYIPDMVEIKGVPYCVTEETFYIVPQEG